jgi:hypothetical protein
MHTTFFFVLLVYYVYNHMLKHIRYIKYIKYLKYLNLYRFRAFIGPSSGVIKYIYFGRHFAWLTYCTYHLLPVLAPNYKQHISVPYFFGHYPSSQILNKIQRFRDWLCLRPQVIKQGKGKREVILAGGSLRQS